MNNPKSNHFVTKAYLESFTDNEGYLHLYSKKEKKFRRQKPKETMVWNKFYRQEEAPEGVDKNILEKRLGEHTEPKGLASLSKLIANPKEITADDTAGGKCAGSEVRRVRSTPPHNRTLSLNS